LAFRASVPLNSAARLHVLHALQSAMPCAGVDLVEIDLSALTADEAQAVMRFVAGVESELKRTTSGTLMVPGSNGRIRLSWATWEWLLAAVNHRNTGTRNLAPE
jgi:hypothetical protein